MTKFDLVILDELGLSAFQCLWRSIVVPSAEQALRAHQCRHHHQPQLQRMGQGHSLRPLLSYDFSSSCVKLE